MSLPGSPLPAGPRWAPTHVQVTVLQARGLRAKAKGGGGSDAYAVMALGKEKFATSVAERCLGSPVWREEATFELPPPPRRGLSGYEEGGRGAQPATLQLTVSHRALLGLDKFLGRAEINLAELQDEGGRRSTRSTISFAVSSSFQDYPTPLILREQKDGISFSPNRGRKKKRGVK